MNDLENGTAGRGTARGFTLVELLVVVAIIAILAAIAFPVLGSAQGRSRRAECLSNVRQIGMAFTAYGDDWDGRYPAAWNEWHTPQYAASGPYSIQSPGLVETLAPLGATPALWRCPADTGLDLRFQGYWQTGPSRPFWKDAGQSYYFRDMGDRAIAPAYPNRDNSSLAGRPATDVTQPTATLLMMEVMPWHARPHGEDYFTYTGRTVALYCDGHAAVAPWVDARNNLFTSPRAAN